MMNTLSIARPYAKAAFAFASANHALSFWSTALHVLSLAVSDTAVKALLKNPNCTKTQSCELLIDFLEKAMHQQNAQSFESINHFLQVLAEHKRLFLLPDIDTLFEEKAAEQAGYLSATITSAFKLTEEQQDATTKKLSKQLQSPLQVTFSSDSRVMAGVLARMGHWVIDDTVSGKLKRLKTALMH